MENIRVVHVSHYNGDGVYVGRGCYGFGKSVLANPFVIGKDGDRNEVIEKYRKWLWIEYNKGGEARNELERLSDIVRRGDRLVLMCWCKPKACHGDVIKRCIDWMLT